MDVSEGGVFVGSSFQTFPGLVGDYGESTPWYSCLMDGFGERACMVLA
jgi:hypothetical protein